MTWFKVDDGFWSHPKTMALSADAVALWVRAGAYSCQHLTDGFIGKPVLRLVGDTEAARELVQAGLWLDAPGGWRFHDWGDYQETSEAVKNRQANARERQRKARAAREAKRHESQMESRSESHVTGAVTNAVSSQEVSYPRPDPTRPDPTIRDQQSGARKRGTRLTDDWMPDESVITAMRTERPDVDLEAEHRKFVDYWIAKTRDATKLDWNATWRNWIRNSKPGQQTTTATARGTEWVDVGERLAQRMESGDPNPRSLHA